MKLTADEATSYIFSNAAEPSTSYWHINISRHSWSCLPCVEEVERNGCGKNHITTLAHWFYNAHRWTRWFIRRVIEFGRAFISKSQKGHRAGTNVRQTMSALRWRSEWKLEATDPGQAKHASRAMSPQGLVLILADKKWESWCSDAAMYSSVWKNLNNWNCIE